MADSAGGETAEDAVGARLWLALKASGMGTFLWYPQEDRTEPDGRMLELFGLPADGSISLASALATLIHPDDQTRYADAVVRATDPHGSGELREEIRVSMPDGTIRWLSVTGQMAFAEGKPARLAGVVADVTARRNGEEALRTSDRQQAFVLELADRLGSESDPRLLATLACEYVGEFLSIDWLGYGDVDDAGLVKFVAEPHDSQAAATRALSELCASPDEFRAGRLVLSSDAEAASAAVPIARRGRAVAGLFARQASPRRWSAAERGLLQEAAMRTWEAVERGRAEQTAALERARRYRREREISIRLQESLMAGHKEAPPGFQVTQSYRAGHDDMRVGGDWTDMVILEGNRLALTVGDVVGKGIDAAATMGRLRSATAAISLGKNPPGEAIDWLERFAAKVAGARYATLAVAIIDADTGTISYSCAGHPPPLLIDADGARYLWEARSTPLHAGSAAPRPTASVTVTPPAMLILYTDGLIERRGEVIDAGLDRLAVAALQHRDQPIEALRDAILSELLDTDASHHDDTAIAIVRLDATPLAT
jgi:PAS domain S-box-containing protein